MKVEVDFLVIGSGLAGLSFALKVADKGKVLLVSKTSLEENNTKYAQGGIASVTYVPDSFEKHINDTLVCGDGYGDKDVVEMVVKEAPDRINELIDMGVEFDKNMDGKYDLAKEGGHSEHRILHAKDATGLKIMEALLKQVQSHPNIETRENSFAIDLITQHHLGKIVKRSHSDIECYGAYLLDTISKEVCTVLAKITVVATGGIGSTYMTSTNPVGSTGDGVALAYRAKGVIENMEFIQFHPTSLYNPGEHPSFLITEALRGFGAVLRNAAGEKFMKKYDPRGSLASRDIVARAIDNEMKITGEDFVWLDCTQLDSKELISHFPTITKKCLSLGIDIRKDKIPVVPAAHYQCGGIKSDIFGRSTIQNLYAIGEVSSTGLHGANRLASNSLMEAVVFAHRAAKDACQRIETISLKDNIPEWDFGGTTHPEEMVLVTQNFREVQQIMSVYVGIFRSNLRLDRALKRLEIIYQETEVLYKRSTLSSQLCELRNMINVGYLVIKMAQNLHESRGLHYTISYPNKKRRSEF
ncbi:MAG: L-aspartate oxidase [Bacteroidales bacterium]|nr:L-aspartate oxidase [Bacteroidales bacterium]